MRPAGTPGRKRFEGGAPQERSSKDCPGPASSTFSDLLCLLLDTSVEIWPGEEIPRKAQDVVRLVFKHLTHENADHVPDLRVRLQIALVVLSNSNLNT